jgi:hypothetical protein
MSGLRFRLSATICSRRGLAEVVNMSRFHIFAETVGGGKRVKIAECEHLVDAITKISEMKQITIEDKKYCRFEVFDIDNLDRLAYFEVVK